LSLIKAVDIEQAKRARLKDPHHPLQKVKMTAT
jgi:hypothetical protein